MFSSIVGSVIGLILFLLALPLLLIAAIVLLPVLLTALLVAAIVGLVIGVVGFLMEVLGAALSLGLELMAWIVGTMIALGAVFVAMLFFGLPVIVLAALAIGMVWLVAVLARSGTSAPRTTAPALSA